MPPFCLLPSVTLSLERLRYPRAAPPGGRPSDCDYRSNWPQEEGKNTQYIDPRPGSLLGVGAAGPGGIGGVRHRRESVSALPLRDERGAERAILDSREDRPRRRRRPGARPPGR